MRKNVRDHGRSRENSAQREQKIHVTPLNLRNLICSAFPKGKYRRRVQPAAASAINGHPRPSTAHDIGDRIGRRRRRAIELNADSAGGGSIEALPPCTVQSGRCGPNMPMLCHASRRVTGTCRSCA